MTHQPPDQLGDLDIEEFRRRGYEAIDWIADYLAGVERLPVLSTARPGDLLAALPEHGPEAPVDWDRQLADLQELILPGLTHWNHPRFLAYFANTGSAPGILGTAIATALNPNGMLWRTSPAATELEQRVVQWIAEWVGLPRETFGIINDTASTSSLCALAAARQEAPGYRRGGGVRALPASLRLYESEQAHSSIDKAALVLGLGQDAVCKIPTRADYSLDPDELAAAIARDRDAGLVPFCVVATIGTTAMTAIDPVLAIADICERERLWLHVDAAYGGPLAMLPEARPMFHGWERADSIVINPHKWMFTPMCASLLYTRRPASLREAFSLVPEYLRSDVGDDRGALDGTDASEPTPIDFMNYGIQLGRPFRSLKLWMVLCTYGRRGIQERLRHHLQLAHQLADRIDAHADFERLAPTPMSTICFRCRPGVGRSGDGRDLAPVQQDEWAPLNERILAEVNGSGSAFLSHARLRGRMTLRLAIGNIRTGAADIETAWTAIETAAGQRR